MENDISIYVGQALLCICMAVTEFYSTRYVALYWRVSSMLCAR